MKNKPELRPLNKRIIVKPTEAPTKVGGIYLPDEAKKKPTSGTIVAIADDVTTKLALGDVVYYGQYAGTELTVSDLKLTVVKEEELIGVLDAGKQPEDFAAIFDTLPITLTNR